MLVEVSMKSKSDYLRYLYSIKGLNLEELVEKESFINSHPIDYQWLKKPAKIGKRSRNQKSAYPNIGYLYRIVTLLLECEMFSHKPKGYFHPISKETFGNYVPAKLVKKLKEILENLGVIDENPKHLPKSVAKTRKPFCKSYRFTAPYQDSMPVEIIKDFGIQERVLKKRRHRHWRNKESRPPELSWLEKQIHQLEILPEAFEEIDRYEFKSERAKGFTRILLSKIDELRAGLTDQLFFSRDDTIDRVHSPITTLKKDFRRFLRFQGDPIAIVDAVACHPFLLLSLYNEPSLKNDPEAQIEAQRYYSLWELRHGKRDFYIAFNDLGELGMERNDMKSGFYTEFLYCPKPKKGNGEKIAAVYEMHFPKLYGLMKRIKSARYLPDGDPYFKTTRSSNHGQLAVMMFRRETRAFIDESVGEIFSGDKFWVVTIHDALCCHPDNIDKIKDILARNLKAQTGFHPVLDVENPSEVKPASALQRQVKKKISCRDPLKPIGRGIHNRQPFTRKLAKQGAVENMSLEARKNAARLGVEGVTMPETHPQRAGDWMPEDPESFFTNANN